MCICRPAVLLEGDNMVDRGSAFLRSVVGEDGARALAKATEAIPSLVTALVPRAIVGWILASGDSFDGPIPGLPNSRLALRKREEDCYTGLITIGDHAYVFTDETLAKTAACIAVALGVDARKINPRIRKADLGRLGKSVDLLVKAEQEKKTGSKITSSSLKSLYEPEPTPKNFYRGISQEEYDYIRNKGHILSDERWCVPGEGTCFGADKDTAASFVNFGRTDPRKTGKPTYVIEVTGGPEFAQDKRDGYWKTPQPIPASRISRIWKYLPKDDDLEEIEETLTLKNEMKPQKGKAHAPTPPKGPEPPTKQQETQMFNRRRVQSAPGIGFSIGKSELATARCHTCRKPEFQGESFVGCDCIKSLVKAGDYSFSRQKDGSFHFSFGKSWGPDAITALVRAVKAVKGKKNG